MKMAKMVNYILILFLSPVFFLSSSVSPDLCLSKGIPSTKAVPSSYSYESDHPDHHQSTCYNKSPCSNNYYCCNLILESTASYIFGLDYSSLNPIENFFHPLRIAEALFHQPRTTHL
jgi:hypothetical protein